MSQSCRPCRVIPFDFSMRVWPYEEEQASFESLFPDRIVSQPITPAASDRAKIESCWPVCCSVLAYANRRVASRELILFFFFPPHYERDHSLHSVCNNRVATWTVVSWLREISRVAMRNTHLVVETYFELLVLGIEKDARNGSLLQGGKKLRSLGMFREAGCDLFEG